MSSDTDTPANPPSSVAIPPPTQPTHNLAHAPSAVKAGWLCLLIGCLTFWFFGLGFGFLCASFILGVVALCTNRMRHGVLLVLLSMVAAVVCLFGGLFLVSAVFRSALSHAAATEQSNAVAEPAEPFKRSLRVNVNTAIESDLESLPGIGPSKAQQIISHRPYQTADELMRVPGISATVLEEMRLFVKTDGPTEKVSMSKTTRTETESTPPGR